MRSRERREVIVTELRGIGGLFGHLLILLLPIIAGVPAFGPFLLLVVRWHCSPDEDLGWLVQTVSRLSHEATPTILLLLLQFANAGSSRSHILIE